MPSRMRDAESVPLPLLSLVVANLGPQAVFPEIVNVSPSSQSLSVPPDSVPVTVVSVFAVIVAVDPSVLFVVSRVRPKLLERESRLLHHASLLVILGRQFGKFDRRLIRSGRSCLCRFPGASR